jgi:hypothetical protein
MYYILATGNDNKVYEDPHAVNAMYNRAESATLYKVSDQGDMEVVKSK